jgi:hypothetical protein
MMKKKGRKKRQGQQIEAKAEEERANISSTEICVITMVTMMRGHPITH